LLTTPRIPIWVAISLLGCGGIISVGGFFMTCASSIATSYEDIPMYRGVMWIGIAMMVSGFLIAIWNAFRRK